MKKIQIKKKLSLNKEAISKLNTTNLSGVKGGGFPITLSFTGICCFIDSAKRHCITVQCQEK